VLVDIPKDVQNQRIEVANGPNRAERMPVRRAERRPRRAGGGDDQRGRAPILYLGGGVVHSGASAQAVELAEKASLPTVMTLMALGAMPVDHPLSLGMLGMHGARCTNLALDECDLLIAVGARFDDRATGKVAGFLSAGEDHPHRHRPSELDKIKTAHIGIHGDVAAVLERCCRSVKANLRETWLGRMPN
jgi:acetolactate synthase-1/2/3 large subunit